jgi:hypothetical protein
MLFWPLQARERRACMQRDVHSEFWATGHFELGSCEQMQTFDARSHLKAYEYNRFTRSWSLTTEKKPGVVFRSSECHRVTIGACCWRCPAPYEHAVNAAAPVLQASHASDLQLLTYAFVVLLPPGTGHAGPHLPHGYASPGCELC